MGAVAPVAETETGIEKVEALENSDEWDATDGYCPRRCWTCT
jgi:hypothetical protein